MSAGNSWSLWVYCVVVFLLAAFGGPLDVHKDRPSPHCCTLSDQMA